MILRMQYIVFLKKIHHFPFSETSLAVAEIPFRNRLLSKSLCFKEEAGW